MDQTSICLYLCCSSMSVWMAWAPFPQQQLGESGSSTPAHLCRARCGCGTTTALWANLRLQSWQQRTSGSVEPQAVRGYSIYPSCWVCFQFVRKSKLLYSSTRTWWNWTRTSVYTCSQESQLAGLGSKPEIHSKLKLLQNKAHPESFKRDLKQVANSTGH